MTFRRKHTILALVVFFASACGSHEDSDKNAQSSDAGPDAAADSGDDKPTAGRGGSGGRGGATASGQSGAGGASGRGGAPAAAGAGGSGGAGGAPGRSGRAGRGGSSGEGGRGAAPAAGTGGAAARAGAGAPAAGAGGTAGTNVDDDDAGVPDALPGPFYSSGTIKGHLWVSQSGVGTTLTTTGYAVPEATAPVCIQGSVVATPDYNSNANLGINLNQLMNQVPAAFTPTLAGIQLEVTNRGMSPLRIQIQTADGAGTWCQIVNGAGGFIPWADFNTACWDGSGTAYAGQPIATANLQVPGGITAAIPYDVCLVRLAETAAPVGPPPPPPVAGAPAPPPPVAGAPAPPPAG